MSKRTASLSKINEKANHTLAKKRKLSGPGVSKSSHSPVHSILHLQRTAGNQEVQRLLKSGTLQAKLKIGKPNDKYEQEADRVADKVMSMPEPGIQRQPEEEKEEIRAKPLAEQITPLVQRQVGPEEEEEPVQTKLLQRQEAEEEEEEPVQAKRIQRQETEEEEEPGQTKLLQRQETEEEEEPVQTKLLQRQENEAEEEQVQTKLIQRQPEYEEEEPIQRQPQEEKEKEPVQAKQASNQTPAVTSNIESSINSLKGGEQPLSESTRSYFEPRFGVDFSQVRVHTDSKAVEASKSVNAKAFTTGKDVVFGAGQYSPGTSTGKRLLAHELTHVVQQRAGGQHLSSTKLAISGPPKARVQRGLRSWIRKIKKKVKKTLGGIKGIAKSTWNAVKSAGSFAVKVAKRLGKGAANLIKKYGKKVVDFLSKWGKRAIGWIKKWGTRVIGWVKKWGDPCEQPPTHITTMDDYIALVQRAEAAYPVTGTTPRNMITRIRRTKYSGFPWSSFVTAPSSQDALAARGSLTEADIQAFACDIMVSMPGGGSTDPSHVIVGLDVRRYPGSSILAPEGVSAEAATTWAGDVGSAYSEYIAQNSPPSEASSDSQTRLNYWNEFSPYHDLMGDVDGLAMSAPQTPQWNFDENQPLSTNLRDFFSPTQGQGRHRRFTLFASVAGIQWTGQGSTINITQASRTNVIERQIDLFVRGNLPTHLQFTLNSTQISAPSTGGVEGGFGGSALADIFYWRKYRIRVQQLQWFIDRFVNFVLDGLRRENP